MSTDDTPRPTPMGRVPAAGAPEPSSTPEPAGSSTPVSSTPVVTPPGATLGAEARAARAAHVAERPSPLPPEPAPAPTPVPQPPRPSTGTDPAGTKPAAPGTDGSHPGTDATTTGDPFPHPVAPRSVGFGGHLLGALFGLVLGPLAVLVAGLGQSRIVHAYTAPQSAWVDGLGITLVALGAALLIGVVLLGLWTAAVPITGGAVVTAVGLTFIVIPERAYTETLRLFRTDANSVTVVNLATQGVSGVVLLLGVLLLTAGIAVSVARVIGRRRALLDAASRVPTRSA